MQNTVIKHNEIWNASDGSIESGWGWGGSDFDANISITYNKIVNSVSIDTAPRRHACYILRHASFN